MAAVEWRAGMLCSYVSRKDEFVRRGMQDEVTLWTLVLRLSEVFGKKLGFVSCLGADLDGRS